MSRSIKLHEPFQKERVPESAIVSFILKYPALTKRVWELHEEYRSKIDVRKYHCSVWKQAGKRFGRHEDTKTWLWLIQLHFNYASKLYWQTSHVNRFLTIYKKHFINRSA